MAVGFPTKANWAAGDVLTASAMDDLAGTVNLLSPAGVTSGYALTANGTSNSVTWTALTSSNPTANPVLNSSMNVWQRGTSIAGSAGSYNYTADRWQTEASASLTISRQTTADTTNLPFIQYCARVQRNNASTSTSLPMFSQSVETLNSIPFAGKTVTLSFYARKGANFSSTSNVLNAYLISGTGTDQNVWVGGYTGATNVIAATPTLTATWQRFTYSATIATSATQIGLQFYYTPTGTAGAADYYEITGVQVDIGSTAQAFRTNGNTYEAELAACQRYYWRETSGVAYGALSPFGVAKSTTVAAIAVKCPVTMRTYPSAVEYANIALFDGTTVTAITSLSLTYQTADYPYIEATVASGLIATRPYNIFSNNNSAGYLAFTAEL